MGLRSPSSESKLPRLVGWNPATRHQLSGHPALLHGGSVPMLMTGARGTGREGTMIVFLTIAAVVFVMLPLVVQEFFINGRK